MGNRKRTRKRKRHRNGVRRAVRPSDAMALTVESVSESRDQFVTVRATRGVRISWRRFQECEDGGGI